MAIENLEVVEQSLGLEKGKLTEMLNSEENHTINLDNLVIKQKSDFDSLLSNIKKESGQAAIEIAVKNARKDLGLEFEGKTLENLLKYYGEKVEKDAKVDPNKKYDSLKEDFEKLQNNLQDWKTKYTDLETSVKRKEQERKINETLLKEIPENTTIPKDDVLAILKAKYQFNLGEDGFEIIGQDGKIMKNPSNMNLTKPNEFMVDFIKPYLKSVEGGAGKGDSKVSDKETSLDIFNKRMEAKNINVGSEVYNEEMSLAISNGTLKF